MGQNDDLNTSIAHIVLCCVAGNSMGNLSGSNFIHPGMHANFLIHGILGILHYQSGTFNYDFAPAYGISLQASKYLALPSLMADLNHNDKNIRILHVLSGVIPFALAVSGKENVKAGNFFIAANIFCLCYYAFKRNKEWAWYTAGAGAMAYFGAPASGKKVLYPILLALMEYCGHKVYQNHIW